MSFGDEGLNDAVAGATAGAPWLAVNTTDPGTTGAGVDTDVPLEQANWLAPDAGSADSSQIEWEIPGDGGTRTYGWFSAWDGSDTGTAVFKFGGPLDESEQFSNNGGILRFTGTVVGTDNTA